MLTADGSKLCYSGYLYIAANIQTYIFPYRTLYYHIFTALFQQLLIWLSNWKLVSHNCSVFLILGQSLYIYVSYVAKLSYQLSSVVPQSLSPAIFPSMNPSSIYKKQIGTPDLLNPGVFPLSQYVQQTWTYTDLPYR